jgi:hypothetical protein
MIPIFTGKVNSPNDAPYSTIFYDEQLKLRKYLQPLNGQRVEVIIRKPKTSRSTLQNSYYFGVVVEILAKELGYDKDEIHEILKYKFLQSNAMGMPYVKSTTKLSTGEFEDYLEKIRRWAAEFLNINIPLPNECEAA